MLGVRREAVDFQNIPECARLIVLKKAEKMHRCGLLCESCTELSQFNFQFPTKVPKTRMNHLELFHKIVSDKTHVFCDTIFVKKFIMNQRVLD